MAQCQIVFGLKTDTFMVKKKKKEKKKKDTAELGLPPNLLYTEKF